MDKVNELPRGMRNNNPGNLIESGIPWVGKVGVDGIFVKFSHMQLGIRAWFKNYYTAVEKRGADTVREFIERYAPEKHKGNDTEAYIKSVCDSTGLTAESLMPISKAGMKRFFVAMMRVENGKAAELISEKDIDSGWNLAQKPKVS